MEFLFIRESTAGDDESMVALHRKLIDYLRYLTCPELDWIQVEVTTRCNTACSYCPHTLFSKSWLSHDMSMETYDRLKPAFKNTGLVFLQGWGEPLLHEDILRMLEIAKKLGCMTGTTTNGILIDDEVANSLVNLDVDIVALSLAGVGENNDNRRGVAFSSVKDAIESINRSKRNRGKEKPALHIAYMALKSNFDDLFSLPEAIAEHGIEELVVSVLDFVPHETLADESLTAEFLESGDRPVKLDNLRRKLMSQGTNVHYRFPTSRQVGLECPENVGRSMFISADGSVSPCVYLGLPISGVVPDYQRPDSKAQRLVFGNVNKSSLSSIWNKRRYREFRQRMDSGTPDEACIGCRRLFTT